MKDYKQQLEQIASTVVRDNAVRVDETGAFPSASIEALKEGGLLSLISSTDVGGEGGSFRDAAVVVERLAAECGSTAMIVCMHYSATTVFEKYGPESVRKDIAANRHLTTLAFSEKGSRSQFWAPVSTATADGDRILLNAEKSWVTSANHADSYVWSSRPLAAEGASTMWLVPANAEGLRTGPAFNGLGLRGNDSTSITATGVAVKPNAMLGGDGKGLEVMLGTVLPLFNILSSANAVGLMNGAINASVGHVIQTRFEHTDSALADLPTIRANVAEMKIDADAARCLLFDTLDALESGRPDGQLRVLQSKAAAGDAATKVLDLAMRVCGGAAFRKEVGVERRFRDGRAGLVMAPTSDHLREFIGRALCGLPVFA